MVRQRARVQKTPNLTQSTVTKSAPPRCDTTAMPEYQKPHSQTQSQPSYAEDDEEAERIKEIKSLSKKSQWILLALASGACAAFNGVFAKLTTTELTTTFATWIADHVGLSKLENGVEVVVRAIFFLLNLVFNGIMWTLFTRALARGTSTTKVSILNTSSNFMITAVLGFMIFSESLPPLWFLGAALLVAGNVIIGRRDEADQKNRVEGEEGKAGEEEDGSLGVEGVMLGFDELSSDERERRRKHEEYILVLDSDSDDGRREI